MGSALGATTAPAIAPPGFLSPACPRNGGGGGGGACLTVRPSEGTSGAAGGGSKPSARWTVR
eukprot:8939257-Alexandrium_andersonii.AAC.1